MSVTFSPIGNGSQFFGANGLPLNGGFLNTFQAGTTTPQATYTTSAGNVANQVSIPLASDGRPPNEIWLTAGVAYKFVLTDALGIPIPGATYDNIVGVIDSGTLSSSSGASLVGYIESGAGAVARTVQSRLRDLVSAKDFGVVGGGVTDDTAAMQAFLVAAAGRIGYLEFGTYLCGSLTIYSGTTLLGDDALNTIIKAKNTLGSTQALMINATTSGSVQAYYDSDITIQGVTFDGNNLGSRTAELVSFTKTIRVSIERCRVQNVGYIGMAFGGSRRVRVRDTDFTATGNPVVTAEGGPALWFGKSGDMSICVDALVTGCGFYNCEWAGIYGTAQRLRIIGNDFNAVKEAGIFTGPTTGVLIKGNTIDGVTKKYISASGIETGAAYVNIAGNIIKNVGNCCISLTDTQQVNIAGNTLAECRQDAVSFPQGSGISVVTSSSSPNQPSYMSVVGNTFTSTGANAYSFFTIGGSGDPCVDVLVEGNEAGGNTFSSGKAFVVAGKWGTNCIRRNNVGSADLDTVIGNFQTNAGTGAQSVTGIGFKPRRLELITTKNSVTEIQQCISTVDASGNCVRHSTASSGGVSYSKSNGSVSATCIEVVTQTGTAQVVATFTSYDDDGFTITLSTTATQAFVQYRAFP